MRKREPAHLEPCPNFRTSSVNTDEMALNANQTSGLLILPLHSFSTSAVAAITILQPRPNSNAGILQAFHNTVQIQEETEHTYKMVSRLSLPFLSPS